MTLRQGLLWLTLNAGLGPEVAALATPGNDCKFTDPSSRQRGHTTSRNPQMSDCNKNWSWGPRWVLDTKTD
jgi:hypothetical protein